MRVLLVSETLHAGGAETFVLRLCRKLNEVGIACDILNLNPDIENPNLLDYYKDLTIKRVPLPFLKWIKRLDNLLRVLSVDFSLQTFLTKKWIERKVISNYSVFHTHLIKVDYLFSLIKEEYPDLKVVSTVHGDYSDYYNKAKEGQDIRWLNLFKKVGFIKERINKWVVISDEQLDFFSNELKLPSSKVVKLYNGFSANFSNKSAPIQNKVFTIGMVSRGVKLKGWSVLVEAFLKMPQDCQLNLVGVGDYIDKLKEQYERHPRINFVGFHPNPVDEIVKLDVFVLPSLFPYESLPTVIIEALYCGKPVIATRVGEIPSMVFDPSSKEDAGFLLDFDGSSLSVDQLYDYLMAYYSNRNLLLAHSALAKKAFQKFDMNNCVNNYVQIYSNLS
ncbi:glycosyltransferase family 4 protein [Rufibacter glacialis]|uniref:Glycosyltransferase family 4 protein n=1 Tax=Rufibacter glacialis TaxID=1259555 RepID=A0A5M8QT03_9BACT|nr:glycosyltransferase family 4 protein [Rufibacter glacialis]KAA6437613.1 glycosyltransferase family 4 protein [Rufibacter glacialis]GGK57816.1 hypothetical protein GCM10011405_02370 [Rufibacter glacialis]